MNRQHRPLVLLTIAIFSLSVSLADAAERVGAEDSVFFSNRFIVPRPLMQAIASSDPVVLLIDDGDWTATADAVAETGGDYQPPEDLDEILRGENALVLLDGLGGIALLRFHQRLERETVDLDAPLHDLELLVAVPGAALDFALVTTQRRNVADTTLEVVGELASDWMDKAQAFAGTATTGPAPRGPR